ncbi:MAG: hypothetical protein WD688_12475 [Candidatus Binatia bacterium]
MWTNVRSLWRDRQVHGLELFFDSLLLVLRFLSISYWIKTLLPDPTDSRRRDNAIDVYCVAQLIILLVILPFGFGPIADSIITGYILSDIYLNLFNIIFIGKIRSINAPPVSIERSILLLFINVLDVVLAFSIFYHHALGLSPMTAFFKAVLVLGTIGYPENATGFWVLLVSLQVFLDFVLIALVFGSFVGQVGLFQRTPTAGTTAELRKWKVFGRQDLED